MLVSVIIPCYNVQDYIEECTNSIMAQAYKEIEIIFIDNNSTDSTWKILQQIKKENPEVIVEQEKTPGAPAARNKGLSRAKGKWIQFLDADDLLLPEKIEHQVRLISTKPNAGFIVGACLKRSFKGEQRMVIPINNDPYKALFTTDLGNTCSNLWKREYLEKINGWNEELKSSQEADLMFRLLQVNEKVIYDVEPFTIVRERASGQISQRDPKEKWLQYINKRKEMVEWLNLHKLDYYTRNRLFYDNALFQIFKILAKEDLEFSNSLFKEVLREDFNFDPYHGHSTKSYFLLYKMVGFYRTEKLRNFLAK